MDDCRCYFLSVLLVTGDQMYYFKVFVRVLGQISKVSIGIQIKNWSLVSMSSYVTTPFISWLKFLLGHAFTHSDESSIKCHSLSLAMFLEALLRFWKRSQITHWRGFLHQVTIPTIHQHVSGLHSLLLHPSFVLVFSYSLLNHPLLRFSNDFRLLAILFPCFSKTPKFNSQTPSFTLHIPPIIFLHTYSPHLPHFTINPSLCYT